MKAEKKTKENRKKESEEKKGGNDERNGERNKSATAEVIKYSYINNRILLVT